MTLSDTWRVFVSARDETIDKLRDRITRLADDEVENSVRFGSHSSKAPLAPICVFVRKIHIGLVRWSDEYERILHDGLPAGSPHGVRKSAPSCRAHRVPSV